MSRIALSRLLARRADTDMQTLFIDEGFGTQDAHGRENLVKAIHMIKDEFALVLVITHIDELKEQFPVRIQVVKEDGVGSRYFVSREDCLNAFLQSQAFARKAFLR